MKFRMRSSTRHPRMELEPMAGSTAPSRISLMQPQRSRPTGRKIPRAYRRPTILGGDAPGFFLAASTTNEERAHPVGTDNSGELRSPPCLTSIDRQKDEDVAARCHLLCTD